MLEPQNNHGSQNEMTENDTKITSIKPTKSSKSSSRKANSLKSPHPESLMKLLKKGVYEEIKRAIRKGIYLNEIEHGSGKNILHKLAETQAEWVVSVGELIINKNFDINLQDSQGNTPLTLSFFSHNFQLSLLFLESADLKSISVLNSNGRSSVHILFSTIPKDSEKEHYNKILQKIYLKQVPMNVPSSTGETPLFIASNTGNSLALISLLQQKVIDINQQNKDKETALYSSVKKKQLETSQILIEYGIDFEILTKFGDSPLELAKARNLTPIVELLDDSTISTVIMPPSRRAYYKNRETKVILCQRIVKNYLKRKCINNGDISALRRDSLQTIDEDAESGTGVITGLRKIKKFVDKSRRLSAGFTVSSVFGDTIDPRKLVEKTGLTTSSSTPQSFNSSTIIPTNTSPSSINSSLVGLSYSSSSSPSSSGNRHSEEQQKSLIRIIQIPKKESNIQESNEKTRRNTITKVGDESDQSSIFRLLHLTVIEAKSLKDPVSDSYCEIVIGQVHLRTKVAWGKKEDPYWGEDIFLQLNQLFPISVTLWDSSKKLIGQSILNIEDYSDKDNMEQVFPLIQTSRDDYVSGDIHLRIEYNPDPVPILLVKVLEAKNLASKNANGFSDPFVRIAYGGWVKKTKVVKKSLHPLWNQEFEFGGASCVNVLTSPNNGTEYVQVSVWNNDLMGLHAFMGHVFIDVNSIITNNNNNNSNNNINNNNNNTEGNNNSNYSGGGGGGSSSSSSSSSSSGSSSSSSNVNIIDKWYHLQPFPVDNQSKIGQLRVRTKYNEQILLTVQDYEPLYQILVSEGFELVKKMGEIVKSEREEVAKSLVKIFSSKYKSLTLVQNVIGSEIDNLSAAETMFRGNTLGTKVVDVFLKEVALNYLSKTLEPVIREIYSYKKSCEVDPTKVDKVEQIPKNFKQLLYYVEKIVRHIFDSVEDCPWIVRKMFNFIQKKIEDKFSKETLRYTSVSSFLFLRFFCPAIISPKLFDIVEEYAGDETTVRTLTLVSKTVQNLANLVQFGHKEEYMKEMNDFIIDNLENMKKFIDSIANPPSFAPDGVPEPTGNVQKYYAYLHLLLSSQKSKLFDDPNRKFVTPLMTILEQLDEKTEHQKQLEREKLPDIPVAIKLRDCGSLYSLLLEIETYISSKSDSFLEKMNDGSFGKRSGSAVLNNHDKNSTTRQSPNLNLSTESEWSTNSGNENSTQITNETQELNILRHRIEYLTKYLLPILEEVISRETSNYNPSPNIRSLYNMVEGVNRPLSTPRIINSNNQRDIRSMSVLRWTNDDI